MDDLPIKMASPLSIKKAGRTRRPAPHKSAAPRTTALAHSRAMLDKLDGVHNLHIFRFINGEVESRPHVLIKGLPRKARPNPFKGIPIPYINHLMHCLFDFSRRLFSRLCGRIPDSHKNHSFIKFRERSRPRIYYGIGKTGSVKDAPAPRSGEKIFPASFFPDHQFWPEKIFHP